MTSWAETYLLWILTIIQGLVQAHEVFLLPTTVAQNVAERFTHAAKLIFLNNAKKQARTLFRLWHYKLRNPALLGRSLPLA